jgi:hypothetical protein
MSLCLPQANPCTAVVCSPNDAGFEVYPSDCVLVPPSTSPDRKSCGAVSGHPHYYDCGHSLLGPPCVSIGVGSVGGAFCCP